MATRNTSSQFQLSPATHCASVYERRSRTFTIRTLHRHHKYVLPDNQRGLILAEKERIRKIPHVEFDTPHGMAYLTATTTEDPKRAKIQKRNYVKNPTEFKNSYTSITALTEKLQTNTKFQRWHVIDEECFKEDTRSVLKKTGCLLNRLWWWEQWRSFVIRCLNSQNKSPSSHRSSSRMRTNRTQKKTETEWEWWAELDEGRRRQGDSSSSRL